jgi:hypothetical protein
MHSQRLRCRALGCGSAFIALALVLFPTGASQARPQRDLATVDLRVRPGDLKPAPRPLVPYAAPELDEEPVYALSEQVEATDRARRSEIPDRRREQNLLDIGSEGSLLEELLENQTIPIFWVTVEPPF